MKTDITEYIGRPVDPAALSKVMSFGSIYPTDMQPPAFGITQRIYDLWQDKGIMICISLEYSTVITSVDVEKYYDASQDFYHPETQYLSMNPQELRIMRRILDYITE